MKVLIIGANGFLGGYLFEDFSKAFQVQGTFFEGEHAGHLYLDVTSRKQIQDVFKKVKPSIAIMPAAVSNVDFCEQNRDLAWKVNVEGTKEVAVCCRKEGVFLTFYSTDYVFDGTAGPYGEDDRTHPISFYGTTKLEAELVIKKELEHFLVLRTCGLYGYQEAGRNFAMHVLRKLKKQEEVLALTNQSYTPTYVEDLSQKTLELVKRSKVGIYNVAGLDIVGRVEFTKAIARTFGFSEELVREIHSSELKLSAERPQKAGLKVDKIIREIQAKPVSVKDGLLAMKARMLNEKVL